MFLETWGILYYGFLARLPLIWREWERFLSSISGLNTLILGEQGVRWYHWPTWDMMEEPYRWMSDQRSGME